MKKFKPIAAGSGNYILTPGHQLLLRELGRRNDPIYPDGNCLYASLIKMKAFDRDVKAFRLSVSNALSDGNIDTEGLFLQESLPQIVKNLNTSGHYYGDAGHYAPEFISRLLGINMVIYNEDGTVTLVGAEGRLPEYHLIHFTTGAPHYHATQKIG